MLSSVEETGSGGKPMSDTQVLLGRIAALRKRLDRSAVPADGPTTLAEAVRQVDAGAAHDAAVDAAVRPMTAAVEATPVARPRQLTARARRVLERGRELLAKLRDLADVFPFVSGEDAPGEFTMFERTDPLAIFFRETAAMTDASLRLVAMFPDTATAQLQLCEGVESILSVVARRTDTLYARVDRQRGEIGCVTLLAELLADLEAGRPVGLESFTALADQLLTDASECVPLRFLDVDPDRPELSVARHSLTVARVAARLARHDADLPTRPLDAVLAALLHDVGMLRVPPALLSQSATLDDAARRAVEAHCRAGAEIVTALAPEERWLADVALTHHERRDGTGYPDGLREPQLSPLARFIAVCDVYASLCAARPYRPARDPRTALADTLLMAEQGRLDGRHAERLLSLSFYPPGSAVELADGSLGVVVAAPAGADPARPVVTLLADGNGQPLPLPRHLDLARCDDHTIVRALPTAERRTVAGRLFPEWV
jgi:HD-GYP domain-containing protein (c-di-GMP phosphodiesterase class II)